MIDHIYCDGYHYDRMFADASHDLRFWHDQARRYGAPILELACGTGRVTIPLARAGFTMCGIDVSAPMLEVARQKAATEQVAATWVQADMRAFDLGQTFPLIILPANALCHLLDLRSLEACLAGVHCHLQPDGHFVLAVFVPNLTILTRPADERAQFAAYDDPAGTGRVVVTSTNIYEPDTQINRVIMYRKRLGEDDELMGQLHLRMYFPQELDALLRYNGFAVEHKWGSFDYDAFDGRAQHQLIVCRRA